MDSKPPIRVLLADDDDDDRDLFREALEEAALNAQLTAFHDGDYLMQHLAEVDGNYPDLIFLDINMPRKNGKECLIEIRSNKKFDHVPVIIFSTSAYKDDIEETFAEGANLYVSKTNSFSEAVEVLKKVLRLYNEKILHEKDKSRFMLFAVIHSPHSGL